jgi:nucleotide-binding universal stress UspA family protein
MKTISNSGRRRAIKPASSKRSLGVSAPRGKATLDSQRLRIRSILVPTDFSAPSSKAVLYAMALAEAHDAKLTLLNVVEPIGGTPDFAANPLVIDSREMTERARKGLNRLVTREGIAPERIEKVLVRHGTPFHEITGAAAELKSDLIVIATHGYTGLKHVLLGSTAERVVRHAPCPVLVVREEEREFLTRSNA